MNPLRIAAAVVGAVIVSSLVLSVTPAGTALKHWSDQGTSTETSSSRPYQSPRPETTASAEPDETATTSPAGDADYTGAVSVQPAGCDLYAQRSGKLVAIQATKVQDSDINFLWVCRYRISIASGTPEPDDVASLPVAITVSPSSQKYRGLTIGIPTGYRDDKLTDQIDDPSAMDRGTSVRVSSENWNGADDIDLIVPEGGVGHSNLWVRVAVTKSYGISATDQARIGRSLQAITIVAKQAE